MAVLVTECRVQRPDENRLFPFYDEVWIDLSEQQRGIVRPHLPAEYRPSPKSIFPRSVFRLIDMPCGHPAESMKNFLITVRDENSDIVR